MGKVFTYEYKVLSLANRQLADEQDRKHTQVQSSSTFAKGLNPGDGVGTHTDQRGMGEYRPGAGSR